jgi:hypothetical protein
MSKSYEYEEPPLEDLLLVIPTTRQIHGFLQRCSADKDSTGTLERLCLTSMAFVPMLLEGGASFRPKQVTIDPRMSLRNGVQESGVKRLASRMWNWFDALNICSDLTIMCLSSGLGWAVDVEDSWRSYIV